MRYLRGDGSEIYVDDVTSELTSGEHVEVVFGEGRIQILAISGGRFEVEKIEVPSPEIALRIAAKLARRDHEISELEGRISGLDSEVDYLNRELDALRDDLPIF